jgi:hypothetical protein
MGTLLTAAVLFAAAGCGDGGSAEFAKATAPPPPPADLEKLFRKPEKGKGGAAKAAKKAPAAEKAPPGAATPEAG